MARSWTRLHEHLGAAPGPLDFDMVQRAAADLLEESDDLDWKEHLPQPPRDGRWNELAKNVAAMATPAADCSSSGYGTRPATSPASTPTRPAPSTTTSGSATTSSPTCPTSPSPP
ncbi:hypothetical protein ACIBRY_36355 [Streptomyces anulatus]